MAGAGVHLLAEKLTLGYLDQPVVEDIDLCLAPGERIAIVGASGSGKTTLLHGLAGLLQPRRGRVVVDGAVVGSPSAPCTSRHAAYMFQRPLLLPWRTALDNAALAATVCRPRPPGARNAPLLAWAREQAEAHLIEFGMGTSLDAYPHQLSGGMCQRVALARTLILGRGLVLLDEPFAGLDVITRGDLQEWLKEVMIRHPATWVLVTHDIREAVTLADRVAVLGGKPARIVRWIETAADQAAAIVDPRRFLSVATPEALTGTALLSRQALSEGK